jgi:hypothetical protein
LYKNVPLAVSGNKPFGGKAKSDFPGVHFHKASGKWCSMVVLAERNANGRHKRKHVGLADTPAEAAALRTAFVAANGVAAPTEVRSGKSKVATVTAEAQ